jgi:hypothetical protein
MKKPTIIKQVFFTAMLVTGMNIFSSCNSCSRESKHNTIDPNGYDYAVDENLDSIDSTDNATINDGNSSSTSIDAVSSSDGSKGKNTTPSTSNTKPATTNKPASNNNSDETTKQQEITNKIENSDYGRVYDKNGKPMRDSGSAGSGMGTGTGSTGNNSRVTTREAQKS